MEERRAYAAVAGQMILQLRNARRLSQEGLAKKAQLSQSSLSRFENGQTLPDAYELRMLAAALDHPPHRFLEKIEQAFARTREAAMKVTTGTLWPEVAAGVITGLAMVGVATTLAESEGKGSRKKP